MKCEEVIELMQRELDGDLSKLEQQFLYQHLPSCLGCQALFERLQQLSFQLEALPKVEPPFSIVDNIIPILDKIDAEQLNEKTSTLIQLPSNKNAGTMILKKKSYWLSSAVVAAGLLTIIAAGNLFNQNAEEVTESAGPGIASITADQAGSEETASAGEIEVYTTSEIVQAPGTGQRSLTKHSPNHDKVQEPASSNRDASGSPKQGAGYGGEQDSAKSNSADPNASVSDKRDRPIDSDNREVALTPQADQEQHNMGMGITGFTGNDSVQSSPDGHYTASFGIDHEYLKIDKENQAYYASHTWEAPWSFVRMEWISNSELYYILFHTETGEYEYWLINLEQRTEEKLTEPIKE